MRPVQVPQVSVMPPSDFVFSCATHTWRPQVQPRPSSGLLVGVQTLAVQPGELARRSRQVVTRPSSRKRNNQRVPPGPQARELQTALKRVASLEQELAAARRTAEAAEQARSEQLRSSDAVLGRYRRAWTGLTSLAAERLQAIQSQKENQLDVDAPLSPSASKRACASLEDEEDASRPAMKRQKAALRLESAEEDNAMPEEGPQHSGIAQDDTSELDSDTSRGRTVRAAGAKGQSAVAAASPAPHGESFPARELQAGHRWAEARWIRDGRVVCEAKSLERPAEAPILTRTATRPLHIQTRARRMASRSPNGSTHLQRPGLTDGQAPTTSTLRVMAPQLCADAARAGNLAPSSLRIAMSGALNSNAWAERTWMDRSSASSSRRE